MTTKAASKAASKADRGADKDLHPHDRSPFWEATQKAFRKQSEHASCAVCGGSEALQVHHVHPFHYCINAGRPELELDHSNLISLCEAGETDHHEIFGHLGNFQIYNPQVREHAQRFKGSLQVKTTMRAEVLKLTSKPDPWAAIAADPRKLKAFCDSLPPPRRWDDLNDQCKWQLVAYGVVPDAPVTDVPAAMHAACARYQWSAGSGWYQGAFYKKHGAGTAFFKKNRPAPAK